MKIKLSQYAKLNNITYKTAFAWFQNKLIKEKVEVSPSGSIFIVIDEKPNTDNIPVYTYSRVSSSNKKEDLNRQQLRCIAFCEAKGYSISKNYKEIGSGMNDSRGQLMKLIEQPIGIIVVEHKDRLTRFGFNYIDNLYTKLGGKIVVINRDEFEETDLMKDLVSIITSFCCRLYGMRRGYSKAKEIQSTINTI